MYRIVPANREGPLGKLWHTRAIGASSAEIVMKGRNKYQTEYELFMYLTGRAEKPPMNKWAQAGLDAEPMIAEKWEAFSGRRGESVNLIDSEFDFLVCQIDWLAWELDLAVDFKYPGKVDYEAASKIARNANLLSSGTKLDHWWVAAQHQLMILDHPSIWYYIARDGQPEIGLIVNRDDAFIKKLRKQEVDWWSSYVTMDLAPPKGRKLQMVMDNA